MRRQGYFRGFVVGVALGLMIGSAGLGMAAFGYKGWSRFSEDFKVGYITGFIDMANLARNLDPGGYVDLKYPLVPHVKPSIWREKVNELYAKPENQEYSITSMLQLASHELEKTYGKAMDPQERARQRMEHQLQALRRKREAMGLIPKEPKAQAVAPERIVKDVKIPSTPKEKKWCRCDGKDPKAERARRRAEAEEREKQEEQELMEKAAKATAAKAAADESRGKGDDSQQKDSAGKNPASAEPNDASKSDASKTPVNK